MEGIVPPDGDRGRFMPGFASELTDEQIRDLVAYIRGYFGRAPAWPDVEAEVRKSRKELERTMARRKDDGVRTP